jgi:hypothetical protein
VGVLPSIVTFSLSEPNYKLRDRPYVPGSSVVIDMNVQDPGSTPNWRIRPGNVVVPNSAVKRFVLATDPAGDRNGPAIVLAAAPADATWQSSTITVAIKGGTPIPVILQAATSTNQAAVNDLNNNPVFAANCVADLSGSSVRIQTRLGGADASLMVMSTVPAAFGPTGTGAVGTDADYRVLESFVDLLSNAGVPVHGVGPSALVGAWNKAGLLNLTPEAQAVLARRGSVFG